MNLFNWLFGKTVDSIIADLTKKIQHLEQVVEARAEQAKTHALEIEKHNVLLQGVQAEASRAFAIAGKLKALLS